MNDVERDAHTLHERAQALAQPLGQGLDTTASLEVMVFTTTAVSYALETRFVTAVARLEDVVPVPGTPNFVSGLVNHRGMLLVMVDLADLLNRSGPSQNLRQALICGSQQRELGLAVQEVLEVRHMRPEAFLPFQDENQSAGRVVRGVTSEGLLLLDGAALLADQRLWVNRSDESEG